MITDLQAIGFSRGSLARTIGSADNNAAAALFACALHETLFGYGWRGDGKGSFNQGAIQCGRGWTGKRFTYRDTHPNSDGTSTSYVVDFRAYLMEINGWDDLVRVMYTGRRAEVLAAALSGDWLGVSRAMRATGYYEGFGKTVEDRIANHARAMAKGINRALVVIGAGPIEVPPSAIVEIPDTVRFGSIGETVKLAQRELRLAADGIFGKVTRGATIAYQQQHGLVADGIVGPQTWKKLLSDDYIPAAA